MSGSVFLTNLDDFIAPSQQCVNPLVAPKVEKGTAKSGAKITLTNDFSRNEFDSVKNFPNLIKPKVSVGSEQKVAAVSLNDCLALGVLPLLRLCLFKNKAMKSY